MSVYFHAEFFDGDDWGNLPTTNVANLNARIVLEALGLATEGDDFEDICCGSCPTNDFMGRVLLALAIAPTDEGTDTLAEGGLGTGHALEIKVGRSEGYLQQKLEYLRKIAQWALDNNRNNIVWG